MKHDFALQSLKKMVPVSVKLMNEKGEHPLGYLNTIAADQCGVKGCEWLRYRNAVNVDRPPMAICLRKPAARISSSLTEDRATSEIGQRSTRQNCPYRRKQQRR